MNVPSEFDQWLAREKAQDLQRGKAHEDAEIRRIEQVYGVIRSANSLEARINSILTHYIEPRAKAHSFVVNFVFNNAIIHYGSKVKLLQRISHVEQWTGFPAEAFRVVGEVRNQIAHCIPRRSFSNPPQSVTAMLTEMESEKLVLYSVAGKTGWTEIDIEDAMTKFSDNYFVADQFVAEKTELLAPVAKQKDDLIAKLMGGLTTPFDSVVGRERLAEPNGEADDQA